MKIIKLTKLYNQFSREASRIEKALIESQYVNRNSPHSRYIGEYAAIRLQDAWSNYCRDIIVYSAIYDTADAHNHIYPKSSHRLKNIAEVYDLLRNNWMGGSGQRSRKPSYWEPNWYDPSHVSTCLMILRLSNPNIGGAIGLPTNPIQELRPLRNYVAHRGKETRLELEKILVDPAASVSRVFGGVWNQPIDIISIQTDPTRSPNATVFSEWIERFKVVARSMIY